MHVFNSALGDSAEARSFIPFYQNPATKREREDARELVVREAATAADRRAATLRAIRNEWGAVVRSLNASYKRANDVKLSQSDRASARNRWDSAVQELVALARRGNAIAPGTFNADAAIAQSRARDGANPNAGVSGAAAPSIAAPLLLAALFLV